VSADQPESSRSPPSAAHAMMGDLAETTSAKYQVFGHGTAENIRRGQAKDF